jgi:hypothetical protein
MPRSYSARIAAHSVRSTSSFAPGARSTNAIAVVVVSHIPRDPTTFGPLSGHVGEAKGPNS